MGQRIAHLVGDGQRQLGVRDCEIGMVPLNVAAGLADDLEIADDGISWTMSLSRKLVRSMPRV